MYRRSAQFQLRRQSFATRTTSGRSLVCVLLAMTAVSCARVEDSVDNAAPNSEVDSEQAALDTGTSKPDWTTEYEEMATALDLADDEADALREAFVTRDRVISAWLADDGVRLEELEGEMATAAKAHDLAGVQQIIAQAKPLRDTLRELIQTHQDAIRRTLSDENQVRWAAHGLAERLLELMQPIALTDAQAAQVREQALAAARETAGEPNPSAAGYLRLERAAESQILTDEQRRAFETVKQKNPLRSL
jgi:hypothetical protein